MKQLPPRTRTRAPPVCCGGVGGAAVLATAAAAEVELSYAFMSLFCSLGISQVNARISTLKKGFCMRSISRRLTELFRANKGDKKNKTGSGSSIDIKY